MQRQAEGPSLLPWGLGAGAGGKSISWLVPQSLLSSYTPVTGQGSQASFHFGMVCGKSGQLQRSEMV